MDTPLIAVIVFPRCIPARCAGPVRSSRTTSTPNGTNPLSAVSTVANSAYTSRRAISWPITQPPRLLIKLHQAHSTKAPNTTHNNSAGRSHFIGNSGGWQRWVLQYNVLYNDVYADHLQSHVVCAKTVPARVLSSTRYLHTFGGTRFIAIL